MKCYREVAKAREDDGGSCCFAWKIEGWLGNGDDLLLVLGVGRVLFVGYTQEVKIDIGDSVLVTYFVLDDPVPTARTPG